MARANQPLEYKRLIIDRTFVNDWRGLSGAGWRRYMNTFKNLLTRQEAAAYLYLNVFSK
jgi:hypothetical protein